MAAGSDFITTQKENRERRFRFLVLGYADKLDVCAAEIDKRYGKGFAKSNPALLGAFFSVVMTDLPTDC